MSSRWTRLASTPSRPTRRHLRPPHESRTSHAGCWCWWCCKYRQCGCCGSPVRHGVMVVPVGGALSSAGGAVLFGSAPRSICGVAAHAVFRPSAVAGRGLLGYACVFARSAGPAVAAGAAASRESAVEGWTVEGRRVGQGSGSAVTGHRGWWGRDTDWKQPGRGGMGSPAANREISELWRMLSQARI